MLDQLGRLDDQVVAIGGEVRAVAVEGHRPIRRGPQAEAVGQIQGLHHHRQLVKAVGAQAEHLEMQVDLGGGADLQLCHGEGALLRR